MGNWLTKVNIFLYISLIIKPLTIKKITLLLLAVGFLFSCSEEQEMVTQDGTLLQDQVDVQDDADTDAQEPLVANFEFGAVQVDESQDLGIVNLSTGAVSYRWDFGFNQTSTEQNPEFNFLSHGIYPVTLQVTDAEGNTQEITKSIDVL